MDGYAVRAADVAAATDANPVVLPVLETVRAGQRPSRALAPNSSIRVMTGAPIPAGADSVIRVEDTDGGEERVAIRDARDAGRNVRPRGEDLKPGELAVARGTSLGPAQIGVLASVGAATIAVHRLPRVAILASGDELVDVDRFDEVVRGDRIVSSNSYTLTAAVRSAGAEPVYLGIVPDDPAAYEERLRAAPACDMLITSGGVSVGAFDFTKDVLKALGAQLHLWRVRMRPGAPVGFGTLGDMAWLGLPGNPVSVLVTFELFARPLIRRLRGETNIFPRTVAVRVREDVSIAAPLTHFMRAVIEWDDDRILGAPHRPAGLRTAHVDGASQCVARHPARACTRARRRDGSGHAARRQRAVRSNARRVTGQRISARSKRRCAGDFASSRPTCGSSIGRSRSSTRRAPRI